MWTVIEQHAEGDQKFHGPMTYGSALGMRRRLNRKGVPVVAVVKAGRSRVRSD